MLIFKKKKIYFPLLEKAKGSRGELLPKVTDMRDY